MVTLRNFRKLVLDLLLVFGLRGRRLDHKEFHSRPTKTPLKIAKGSTADPLKRPPTKTQTPPSYGFGRYGFGFFGPRIAFPATGALWGRATPFFYHFSVHLSSLLGQTELCHEVWTPGPQKPQIISNENHHLALFERRPLRRPLPSPPCQAQGVLRFVVPCLSRSPFII